MKIIAAIAFSSALAHITNTKQQPDRIYGLNQTTNFDKLLSQPFVGDDMGTSRTLRAATKTTQFKDSVEPLLFPFLVVEAKIREESEWAR